MVPCCETTFRIRFDPDVLKKLNNLPVNVPMFQNFFEHINIEPFGGTQTMVTGEIFALRNEFSPISHLMPLERVSIYIS